MPKIPDLPLPENGAPMYTAFIDLPPQFQTETSEAYKDGSFDYSLTSDVPVLRWRLEYTNNLRQDEAAVVDGHYSDAGGTSGGFAFTHPRTGIVYRNTHYESFDNPGHEHVDNQSRSIVLVWVLAEYLLIDEFTRASFIGADARQPEEAELLEWRAALEAAHSIGQGALLLEAQTRLVTLFDSAEYLARARDDEEYVSDLYITFFGRSADPDGMAFWVGQVVANGRAAVLAEFTNAQEFIDRVATIYPAK
jgi:hypothetical protein